MSALAKIKQAGFDVSLNDAGSLVIVPASKLTQSQREFLKSHKAQIIDEIKSDGIEWIEYIIPCADDPLTITCYTPNGNPVLVLAKDDAHKACLLRMNPNSTKH